MLWAIMKLAQPLGTTLGIWFCFCFKCQSQPTRCWLQNMSTEAQNMCKRDSKTHYATIEFLWVFEVSIVAWLNKSKNSNICRLQKEREFVVVFTTSTINKHIMQIWNSKETHKNQREYQKLKIGAKQFHHALHVATNQSYLGQATQNCSWQ